MKHLVFGDPRSSRVQFFRYIFVGGSASVVDLIIFVLLMRYLGMHYLWAAFVAYMFGLSWNYVLGLMWIFKSRHPRLLEFFMVFGIALGGLFWTELLLWLVVEYIHLTPLLAKMIVLWIVLFWNFGMRKLFVFH
ncbi:MAG: GtrA family protein [Candidatus Peribacteraceae bacterium]|nr:GtrA family protein [Candidatus Peribacteraceae bacterium]